MDEAAALAGFRANDRKLSAAFFALLMPAVAARLRSRWKRLSRAHEEIEDLCLATVVEWRSSGKLRDGESIADLASRLVNQNVDAVQRVLDADRRVKKAMAAVRQAGARDPEAEAIADELRQRFWEIQATLAPKHQRVLMAYAQSERSGGTALADLLGVSEENAWKLVQRARAALSRAIREAGLKSSDLLEGDHHE